MSDDLDAVIREMWPGLRPGERFDPIPLCTCGHTLSCHVTTAERRGCFPGDVACPCSGFRRLQAVPDKEEQVIENNGLTTDDGGLTTVPLSDWAGGKTMPYSAALATLAETVDRDGKIVTNVHDLPIAFFGRDDVEKINVIVMEDRVHVTGNLVVGGHKFGCFSKGFPMGAE